MILTGSVLLSGAALGVALWPQHGPLGIPVPVLQERPAPAAPGDLADYRLGKAEEQIQAVQAEHRALTGLLLANLVAVIASLATYLLTRRRP